MQPHKCDGKVGGAAHPPSGQLPGALAIGFKGKSSQALACVWQRMRNSTDISAISDREKAGPQQGTADGVK